MDIFNKLKQSLVVRLIKAAQKFGRHRVGILGNTFEISDNVFNPKYYYTSKFMAKHLTITPEDFVLDMGTGSGVQAITAGRTASKVVAVDINPEAVKFARKNVVTNGLEETVSVVEGDLFSPLEEKPLFDVILFTPPYLEGEPQSDFDHALFDPDKALLKKFFNEAKSRLKPDGYVQMLYSSIADHEQALSIASQRGWKHELVKEEKTFSERFLIYRLRLNLEKEL